MRLRPYARGLRKPGVEDGLNQVLRLGARDLAPGTYSLSILRKAAGGWITCQGANPLIR